jgi:hypothetical protein
VLTHKRRQASHWIAKEHVKRALKLVVKRSHSSHQATESSGLSERPHESFVKEKYSHDSGLTALSCKLVRTRNRLVICESEISTKPDRYRHGPPL